MSDAKDTKKTEKGADAADGAKAAGGGGNSKLLGIMVGVNSLLLVGVLGISVVQLMDNKKAAAAAAEAAAAAAAEGEGGKKGEGHGGETKPAKAEGHGGEAKAEAKPAKAEGGEKKEGGEGGHAPAAAAGTLGPIVKLPEFIVHLRNPEVDRYARMSFEIEVIAESDKAELTAALPKVRDAIIVYLSDRTVEDLRGSEGLARAKDAMQSQLRTLVPDARLRAIYISDFVVQ